VKTNLSRPKGILLVNLGTPDSPKTSDVRKYLREFLSDPRVVDINPIGRYILVNAIIAPFRSPKSAATYRKVWLDKGSPLMVYSMELKNQLQDLLGEHYRVGLAMRYQSPSIEQELLAMQAEGIDEIKVIPLFPQYASATGGSVNEKVMEIVGRWQTIPEIEFVKSFHNDPKMIQAFAENGKKWGLENFDFFLFSFHGLPQRQLKKADLSHTHCKGGGDCCRVLTEANKNCYGAQCQDTAHSIARNLYFLPNHIAFRIKVD
jgi:ferrochelatase